LIIDDDSIDVDDDDVAVLAALCIFKPKINDEVPIRKETMVRIFCVMAGIRIIGAPRVVCRGCG